MTHRYTYTNKPIVSLLLLLFIVIGICSCSSNHASDKYLRYPVPHEPIQEFCYTPQQSEFAVWAPTADEVRLMLYTDGENGHPQRMIQMDADEDTGVWRTTISEDLLGYFYTFNVKIDDVWQGDTPGIFAQAVGANGKRAAIIDWDKTNPTNWTTDKPVTTTSNPTDMVIYELHIRSYTVATNSGINPSWRGLFLGLTQDSTFCETPAISTGLAHLKDLGITHVKLMPVFDFNGKDEKEYTEDSFTWGYDPLNCNVPEGSYSTNPSKPYTRIKEFKELIQALHQAGIGVIMDVSYVYSNPATSSFQKTTPGYYFLQETGDNLKLAPNGKAQAATHRPFVVQFIKESLAYWMKEYHIDGFSLDYIQLYEPEALAEIKNHLTAINPSVLLMGDTNNQEEPMDPEAREQIPILMNPYSYALRANPNDSTAQSYLLGNLSLTETFKAGLLAWVPHDSILVDSIPKTWKKWNTSPTQTINYISSHLGNTFSDYLDTHTCSLRYNNEKTRLSKLAYTALLTAQGIPMLYAGEEFFRSKCGHYHSEKYGDKINQLAWDLKTKHLDHSNYIKGLIALRKSHPAFRISNSNLIQKHVEFLNTEQPQLLAYRLKDYANGDEWEDILVIFNTSKKAQRVSIPEGQYIIVCRDGYINEQGLGYAYRQAYVTGQSAMILYRTDKTVYIPQISPEVESEEDVIKEVKQEKTLDLRPIKLPSSLEIEVPNKIKIE